MQPHPVALDRLLSRARPEDHGDTGSDAALCRWFGLDGALPVAPLTWRADTGGPADGYLMRADPVYLRADQSKLRLFDATTFALTQDEADQLVETFNVFYAGQGWQLLAPAPRRWYLRMDTPPDIKTTTLAQMGGQDIDACLPRGAEAADWHRLLNEIQMLFHEHPVNIAREQRGEPVINSLWFWGGGVTPATLRPGVTRIASGHPLGRGLALQAEIPLLEVPEEMESLLATSAGGVTLVVNDALASATQYGDIEHWLEGLRELEQYWFAPLLQALRQGRLDTLEIDPCQGCSFIINKRRLQAFWKRSRPFEDLCRQ